MYLFLFLIVYYLLSDYYSWGNLFHGKDIGPMGLFSGEILGGNIPEYYEVPPL